MDVKGLMALLVNENFYQGKGSFILDNYTIDTKKSGMSFEKFPNPELSPIENPNPLHHPIRS